MANRTKRAARTATLHKEQNQFRRRLRKSKQKHKQLDCNLINAFSEDTLKITGQLPHNNFKKYFQDLDRKNRKLFMDILTHPRILFKDYYFYLLILHLIYVYKGIERPLSTWKAPKSKKPELIVKSLFLHLFVRYRLPKVVVNAIEMILLHNRIKSWHGHLLIGLSLGEGLHRIRFKKLSIPVNGKSNFFLHQAPEAYTLVQAVAWAKLRSAKISHPVSHMLIRNFYTEGYQEWPAWMAEVLGFLQRHPQIIPADINKVLSFIVYQRIRKLQLAIPNATYKVEVEPLFPDFSLKGRTLASIQKYLEQWKEYIAAIKIAGANDTLPKSRFNGYAYRMPNGRLFSFKQILSVKGLIIEGKRMNHCVGSYVEECINQRSSIWSAQLRFPSGRLKKVLTIEINEKNGTLEQIKGMCNRNHSTEEDVAIKAWAAAEKLEFNLE